MSNVAGGFIGNCWFGPTMLTAQGFRGDGYVAKLKADGTFEWAISLGGSNEDSITALAVVGTTLYVGGAVSTARSSHWTRFSSRALPGPGPGKTTQRMRLWLSWSIGEQRPPLSGRTVWGGRDAADP